tara:strand:- start:1064 stop:1732 length:669 start_codon:yes stop_codon:yes gene_type:complete
MADEKVAKRHLSLSEVGAVTRKSQRGKASYTRRAELLEAEGWKVVEPARVEFIRKTKNLAAIPHSQSIPQCSTRLSIFKVMWPIDKVIVDRYRIKEGLKERDRYDSGDREDHAYWAMLAIRIFIYGLNCKKETRKNVLHQFWEDESLIIAKFQGVLTQCNLPYKYQKWSMRFTQMAATLDDWKVLSDAWTAAVTLPEVIASDEKNKKTRCKSNPLVSMVSCC